MVGEWGQIVSKDMGICNGKTHTRSPSAPKWEWKLHYFRRKFRSLIRNCIIQAINSSFSIFRSKWNAFCSYEEAITTVSEDKNNFIRLRFKFIASVLGKWRSCGIKSIEDINCGSAAIQGTRIVSQLSQGGCPGQESTLG